MGGTISPEEIDILMRRPPKPDVSSWKPEAIKILSEMGVEEDRENATEAINSLTAIVMETKNPLLADSCRKTIVLLLEEFAPSKSDDALIAAREQLD